VNCGAALEKRWFSEVTSLNPTAAVFHSDEVRIRLDGKVSTTEVKASDAGQAKK
jgi:hypothetical protein